MIQDILALSVVGAAVLISVYSVYKAVTTKDKSICGGCASCEIKNELKKKGKLVPYSGKQISSTEKYSAENLKYSANTPLNK